MDVADLGLITGGLGVYGTDLGILWDNGNGEILAAFGDTYGGPEHADWRFNVLGVTSGRDLALTPLAARADGAPGEFIDRDPGTRREVTVIPTSGVAAAGVNYVHYMSVRHWGPPGVWVTNHSGIAVSDDHGRTWSRPAAARWRNTWRRDHPFQMGAFARHDEYVYLMGTPNGRFGPGRLARVAEDRVAEIGAYQYWTGRGWIGGDPFAATPVLPAPVAELSLCHNGFTDRWLALYLDERRAAIVLRTAAALTGPWTAPVVVVSGRDYPGLYGGFWHPWTTDGASPHFTMSQWGPYNVRLMRMTLDSSGIFRTDD